MKNSTPWTFVLFLFLSVSFSTELRAQEPYAVYFTPKEHAASRLNEPQKFLSARALERRSKQDISLQPHDLPIAGHRIAGVSALVARKGRASKWLNALYVEATPEQVLALLDLPYVDRVEPIAGTGLQSHSDDPLLNYGQSGGQLTQINIHQGPHLNGHFGEGKLIAVLDAGFVGAQNPEEYGMAPYVVTRNFVNGGTNVFQGSSHGWSVLSTMAVQLPGIFVGTAPRASYALIKTEAEGSETPEELFNWIAGAEFADSIGADIINSSLGYNLFDDPADNYSLEDLDGRTSIISLGALWAARTGMLVVTSAGNEGGSAWNKITFPADADSILTVGAVNEFNLAAAFTSRGYTADGRIKPNVSARGENAVVYRSDGSLAYGNGTSFSSPIMAGAAASLWSAVPEATAQDLIKALEASASHFLFPNTAVGYGIPNLAFAEQYLKQQLNGTAETVVYPIPFNDQLKFFFPDGLAEDVVLKLYTVRYELVAEQTFLAKRFQARWAPGDHLPAGVYILHIERGSAVQTMRVIKSLHP